MRKRTKFGVIIPPWRPNKRPNPITFELVLTGKIPSTKNRQRASFNYSWAISQVKKFFKTQTAADITVANCMRFVIKLIRDIKPFIYKPAEITAWEDNAKAILVKQAAYWKEVYAKQGLSFPVSSCSISIKHYWADAYQRDNGNRQETLHDILVSSGIILDDNYKCLYLIKSEADCFEDEITDHITTINITAYRW